MLGNQESQGDAQDKLSPHLEPDQEVAAVLGTGMKGEWKPRADRQCTEWNIDQYKYINMTCWCNWSHLFITV